jgi:predicted CXXCH cytochrome family protein
MKRNRHNYLLAVLGAGLLGLSGTAFAAVSDATSKHNLGTLGTTANAADSGTGSSGEVCVFCHTPHAGASGSVPLWNRSLAGAPTKVYDSTFSSTIDGAVDVSSGISLACLSCHDGTQAMNTIINTPGSGLAGNTTWSFTDTATMTTAKLTGLPLINDAANGLQNDHPVGIEYGGGTAAGTVGLRADGTGIVRQTAEFKTPAKALLGDGTTIMWYFDTNTAVAGLDAGDVRLYNRTLNGVEQPLVECASCHDPHNTVTTAFLRVENTASAVCTACHTK